MSKSGKVLKIGIPVVVLGGIIAAVVWAVIPRVTLKAESPVPTSPVVKGNLEITLTLNGELQTDKSVTLVPPQAGVPLVIKIAATGDVVKAGDVVMEFDPADQEYTVEVNKSQLAEAEQEIIKLRANAEVQNQQAATELLNARFNVRRAEMDALVPAQFISANTVKMRQLQVDENKRRLAELEAAMSSRAVVDRAGLTSMEQRRNTARVTAERAQAIIDQLEVKAPIDGSVVLRENRDTTNMFYQGMVLPEYRIGDTVLPGRIVVELVDTANVQIRARVSEQDRPNIAVGNVAKVQANGRGGEWLPAKVESIAGLASRADNANPVRRFDVTLRFTSPERILPGSTVTIVVTGKELKDVLHVPRQAVFVKDGEPIVYTREDGRFVSHPVKIVGRTESRVAVEGLSEGVEAALLDPTAKAQEKSGSTSTVLD